MSTIRTTPSSLLLYAMAMGYSTIASAGGPPKFEIQFNFGLESGTEGGDAPQRGMAERERRPRPQP